MLNTDERFRILRSTSIDLFEGSKNTLLETLFVADIDPLGATLIRQFTTQRDLILVTFIIFLAHLKYGPSQE